MLDNYSRVLLLTDRYQSEGAQCFGAGYIIEVYPENKYELEFSGPDGVTTAQIVADGNKLQLAPPASADPTQSPNAPKINAQPIKEYNP